MDNGLIERVARAWADIDGNAEKFDRNKAEKAGGLVGGNYAGYLAAAEELLERSGLAADIAASRALVTRLYVERDSATAAAESLEEEIVALDGRVEELRDAAEQMVRFNDLPFEAKRPDVFNLRLLALSRALAALRDGGDRGTGDPA